MKRLIAVLLMNLMAAGAIAAQEQKPVDERPEIVPFGNKTIDLVDRIVAQVETEPILLSELEQTARIQAAQQGINVLEDSVTFKRMINEALDFLIEQKLLLAQAMVDSIEVEDAEVDRTMDERMDAMARQFGSQAKAEEAMGQSFRDLRRLYKGEIRKQLLTQRLQGMKVNSIEVSRREVEAYFNEHREKLPAVPKRYHIRHILRSVKPGEIAERQALEAMQRIRAMLDEGQNFEDLARDYSEDPGSAADGGYYWVKRGEMVREFEEAVYALEPGQLSDFVRTKFGYHLIYLVERQGERVRVQHILRAVTGTEDDRDQTYRSILELRERIQQGEDFEEIARTYSEDDENKSRGGDLGWYSLEDMRIPEFKEPIEQTAVGDLSAPFKTQFGYHILQVVEVIEGHPITLEEDWDRVENFTLQEKQNRELQEWMAELKEQFYIDYKPQLPDPEDL